MPTSRWELIHSYRRLNPDFVACPHCQTKYAVQIGPDDEPQLKCYPCKVTLTPGKAMYDEIKRQLRDKR